MGFYLRKSISVGPIRFNFSKSGIGVSAGIKGLRFGTGPRGNYVHMGRGGLYYRKTLSNRPAAQKDSINNPEKDYISDVDMKEIESGSVSNMQDSSSVELLTEIQSKTSKMRIWPLCLFVGLFIAFLLNKNNISNTIVVIYYAIFFCTFVYSVYYDMMSKSVVVFYDFDDDAERLYQSLHDTFDKLCSSNKKWHVEAEGDVRDWKRNAGASKVIKRKDTIFTKNPHKYIKSNISIPKIGVGRQVLHFFPERVLVFDGCRVGAVSYSDLNISITNIRFIEDGSVPSDSKVVDRTWKYVNKKGGPDRRFNNNRELPIALYEDLHFSSKSGLNELIELSRIGYGEHFKEAIENLGTYYSKVSGEDS